MSPTIESLEKCKLEIVELRNDNNEFGLFANVSKSNFQKLKEQVDKKVSNNEFERQIEHVEKEISDLHKKMKSELAKKLNADKFNSLLEKQENLADDNDKSMLTKINPAVCASCERPIKNFKGTKAPHTAWNKLQVPKPTFLGPGMVGVKDNLNSERSHHSQEGEQDGQDQITPREVVFDPKV